MRVREHQPLLRRSTAITTAIKGYESFGQVGVVLGEAGGGSVLELLLEGFKDAAGPSPRSTIHGATTTTVRRDR